LNSLNLKTKRVFEASGSDALDGHHAHDGGTFARFAGFQVFG
jgi:hypothetical protein